MIRQRERKILLAILLCVFMIPLALFGQAEVIEQDPNEAIISRTLGDQIFGLNAGLYLPLFSADPNTGKVGWLVDTQERKLSLGAVGTIRWGSFLNDHVNLGLDVTWAFNIGANDDMLSFFSPLQPRISYFFRSGLIEVPIHLALGMNILSYKTSMMLTPLVKFGGSFIYNATPDWGFGFNILYWWVPELYPADTGPGPSANRFGNFLEISFSALYNF